MKIFPIYYFPPVSWFAAAAREETILLEQHIHYRKQQYYNRTRMLGSNKVQALTVPVVRTGENTPYHQREISYAEDWRKNHWKSFESAYRSSAYFEMYEDRFAPIFEQRFERLQDLNLYILEILRDMMQLDLKWELSDSFKEGDAYEVDFRDDFDSRGKKFPEWFEPAPYRQVFGDFAPDLTIVDLLFNMGPETSLILKASWKGA